MDFSIAQRSIFFFVLLPTLLSAQYTDVINSNRPGRAVSAYAVGKGVAQAEVGLFYEQQDNVDLNKCFTKRHGYVLVFKIVFRFYDTL